MTYIIFFLFQSTSIQGYSQAKSSFIYIASQNILCIILWISRCRFGNTLFVCLFFFFPSVIIFLHFWWPFMALFYDGHIHSFTSYHSGSVPFLNYSLVVRNLVCVLFPCMHVSVHFLGKHLIDFVLASWVAEWSFYMLFPRRWSFEFPSVPRPMIWEQKAIASLLFSLMHFVSSWPDVLILESFCLFVELSTQFLDQDGSHCAKAPKDYKMQILSIRGYAQRR